jgi:hypothetical protein
VQGWWGLAGGWNRLRKAGWWVTVCVRAALTHENLCPLACVATQSLAIGSFTVLGEELVYVLHHSDLHGPLPLHGARKGLQDSAAAFGCVLLC